MLEVDLRRQRRGGKRASFLNGGAVGGFTSSPLSLEYRDGVVPVIGTDVSIA